METPVTSRPPLGSPGVELDFSVRGAAPVEYAAAPTIGFELAIESRTHEPIRSVVLDVQIQIAAPRRSYGPGEQSRLGDLFGEAHRWADTLRTVPWLRTTQVVPAFSGETVVGLEVPCSYDFEVSGAKYLAALDDGEVPLEFLFGGTVFYTAAGGGLQTVMIGWDREAGYALPVSVWRETMDRYFPGTAWLRLNRGTFDRLYAYRARHALPSWEHTLAQVLDSAGEGK
jgi:hypothetical protein